MRKAIHAIESPIKEIIDYCNEKKNEKVEALSAGISQKKQTSILIVIMTCLGVVVFVIYLTVSITKPLNESLKLAEKVSSGDLTQEIMIDQEDEIGQLAHALNHMSRNLNLM